ncbi:MAG: DUF6165 family protein [Hyphomicrobiales bacterium]|nr:DUF6165 family protein [Hyphomicrobiales bacterium]
MSPVDGARIMIEAGAGELIDKITILRIKTERMTDATKLVNIRRELDMLRRARARSLPASAELDHLEEELKRINQALWDIEDDIRRCERTGEFGDRFVRLARSVYKQNDRRSALKRRINALTGARIVEEKSYAP